MIGYLRFFCFSFIFLVGCATEFDRQPKWQVIFDGASLKGWTPKIVGEELGEDSLQTFRANDGVLSVNYDQYGKFENKFGHLFYDQKLSDYRLKFEYRFVGEQLRGAPSWAHLNSGVMLHSQDPITMKVGQAFPVSVEAQLLAVFDKMPNRTTANVCTPGTHIVIRDEFVTDHCVNSEMRGFQEGQWVKFDADVRQNESVQLYINGALAFEFTQPQLDSGDKDSQLILGPVTLLSSGYISLQSESHPIEFRNIQLLDRSDEVQTK